MVDDIHIVSKGRGRYELKVKARSQTKALNHKNGHNGDRPIPVRDFLGLTRDERRLARKLIRDAFVKRFKSRS
jgi:hypothetical protein